MSKKVSVLLLEDIDQVGRVGQIISVAEGYARNSLFPEGKAALATTKNVSRASIEKKQQKEKDKIILADLQEKAAALCQENRINWGEGGSRQARFCQQSQAGWWQKEAIGG